MRPAQLMTIALVGALSLAGCVGMQPGTTTTSSSQDLTQQDAATCAPYTNQYFQQHGGAGTLTSDDSWENPCERARGFIQMGGAGALRLTVKDAEGETVLTVEASMAAGGSQEFKTSGRGEPGTWQVEVIGGYAGGVQVQLTPVATP